MTDDGRRSKENGRVKKPVKKGPIEREMRLWGHALFAEFIPWTKAQQIILGYSRMRGLVLCNSKYRYQEALINWALEQSCKTGNEADILCREMIQASAVSTSKLTKSTTLKGKTEVEESFSLLRTSQNTLIPFIWNVKQKSWEFHFHRS
jgi:hypothetical protein